MSIKYHSYSIINVTTYNGELFADLIHSTTNILICHDTLDVCVSRLKAKTESDSIT